MRHNPDYEDENNNEDDGYASSPSIGTPLPSLET
jgi:hypothetical protein